MDTEFWGHMQSLGPGMQDMPRGGSTMVRGGSYPFSRHRLAGSSSEHHHSSPRSEGSSSSSKTGSGLLAIASVILINAQWA